MLGFLLFNAGMGVELSALKKLRSNPLSPVFGLLANLVIPIAFIGVVMLTIRFWQNPDEVQNIMDGHNRLSSHVLRNAKMHLGALKSNPLRLDLYLMLARNSSVEYDVA